MRWKTPLFAHRPKRWWTIFPIAETLGEIAPRNAGSISVHRFDEQPIVRRRAPDMAFAARQKIRDPVPLIVT